MSKEFLQTKLKEIYDFVQLHKMESFHCAGYDYHPKTKLEDFIDPKFDGKQNMILHLNDESKNYIQEKKLLKQRFPNYYFVSCSRNYP
jgi:hypothetical protein